MIDIRLIDACPVRAPEMRERGSLGAVIESDLNIPGIAALLVIVRRVGGVLTALAGREPGPDTTAALAAVPGLRGQLPASCAA